MRVIDNMPHGIEKECIVKECEKRTGLDIWSECERKHYSSNTDETVDNTARAMLAVIANSNLSLKSLKSLVEQLPQHPSKMVRAMKWILRESEASQKPGSTPFQFATLLERSEEFGLSAVEVAGAIAPSRLTALVCRETESAERFLNSSAAHINKATNHSPSAAPEENARQSPQEHRRKA